MKINKYLNMLQEQYDYHVDVTEVKGKFETNWAKCYDDRCLRFTNTYERKFCKYGCQITSLEQSIASFNGLKGKCSGSKNPNKCLNSINGIVKSFQSKLRKTQDSQREARIKMVEFRAKAGV